MIKAVVMDIEGTTSSIRFVHEVLFPYARVHMDAFVRQNADEPVVKKQLAALSMALGRPLSIDEAIAQLIEWIDHDKKITPLKVLQGMIWQQGYENGDYQGHLYKDAYERINEWFDAGIMLYIYSSGSVKAQQLLFAHTEFGDLRPLFKGYFDTQVGGKCEQASYQKIVDAINLPAGEVLFLSDSKAELDAASAVGINIGWLRRGDCQGVAEGAFYRDFYDVVLPHHPNC